MKAFLAFIAASHRLKSKLSRSQSDSSSVECDPGVIQKHSGFGDIDFSYSQMVLSFLEAQNITNRHKFKYIFPALRKDMSSEDDISVLNQWVFDKCQNNCLFLPVPVVLSQFYLRQHIFVCCTQDYYCHNYLMTIASS